MDLSKKQKTQNPNSCCKKKSMMGYCKSIYSCTTYVRHTSRKRRTWREKFSKLLGKRYGVYFSKLSNATFAWWKKSIILNPSDKLLNWISAIFIIQKNKTKKHHFYQQQTLFSNAKKNKTNKNKNYFCSPPSNYRIKSHAV